MKILTVSQKFYPSLASGVVRATYEMCKELVRAGHEVTVYTSNALDQNSKVEERNQVVDINGIKVYYFGAVFHKQAWKHKLFITPKMVNVAQREMRTFEVIHLQEYRSFQNIVAHHYAMKYHVPYVLQAHGSLPRVMTKQRLKQIYDNLWGYKILRDASKVIAQTSTEVEQYKSMGINEDKIEIIPNGIDVSTFGDLPKRGEFRVKYGLKDNQKVILYLGRIYWIKGLELLANAFTDISKDFDQIKLVIVGPDDGYLPTLKKLIKELEMEEKVILTGPLYGKAKLGAYVDADVYVLPSIYETFPSTVLEACACGLPVVITDRCGIADIINGQMGLVVPYDRKQLSDAILRMLTDDKIRQQFSEKGKALVREKFNWSKIVEQLEDIYQTILTKGGRGNEYPVL